MGTIAGKQKQKRKKKGKGEGAKLLEAHPASVYLSDKDLAVRYRNTRASIWRWIRTRGLPEPIQFSPGCSRWRLSDIERWESQNISTPRPAA